MDSVKNNPAPRAVAGLSSSRLRILDLVRQQTEPTTLAALGRATALHPNTVREHLDGLVRRGLVRRLRSVPEGRGRPAWLYEAVSGEPVEEYAGLAVALAVSLGEVGADPGHVARQAGERWGRDLVRGREGRRCGGPEGARAEVVGLLDELGFAPRVDAARPGEVWLTRCPLLEAAHREPTVVCGVHLGLVRGVLREFGADPEGAELRPFVQPGSCLVVVPPR